LRPIQKTTTCKLHLSIMQETIKSREGNKMKKYLVGIYAFVGAIVLTGCVAGGAAFVKDEAVPEDKGLIYIYRPNNFQGSAVDITIKDNGQTVFKIKNGQYVKHFVEPGKHKLHRSEEHTSELQSRENIVC